LLRGRSPLALVYAVVDTRYDVDPEALPNIAAALDGQPVLRLVAWLRLDRSVRLALTSPALVLPESGYSSDGVNGEADFGAASGRAEGSLRIGSLLLREDAGSSIRLDPTEFEFAVQAGEGARPAEGNLDLGAIEIVGPESRVRIATSRATFSGSLEGDEFKTGRFEMTVGDIVSERSDASAAELGKLLGLRILEESELDATRGLQSLATTVSFDQLTSGADVYGPGRLVLAVRNIDVAAVAEFRAALAALDARASADPADDPLGERFAIVEQFMPRLLGSSPEIVLEAFTIGSPHGELSGGGRIGIDGQDASLLGSVLMVMMQTRAVIEFAIPAPIVQSMVESYLVASAREEMPEASEDELRQMAGFMRDTLLEQLVTRGLLIRDGPVYRVDARFEDGMPNLNGQPIDPMLLPGFSSGS
jgi:uncharacterized protein YdgA (DUF945 family)